MDINYNIVSLIKIIGLVQGVFLGILLLFANRNKLKETIFLALFILVFSYGFLPFIVEDIGATKNYPNLYLLPRISEWILCPLFLIYIQKTSIFSDKKAAYWTLYPGIIFLFFQLSFLLTPVDFKIEVMYSTWYKSLFLIGLIYSIGIQILSIRFINKHIEEVENQFSFVHFKKLKWAKRFIFFGFALVGIHVIYFFINPSIYFEIFFSLVNVIMLYWVSLHGILQHKITSLISSTKITISTEEDTTNEINKITPPLSDSDSNLKKLVEDINKHMNTSEVFIHQELTIIDLAEALKVHPRRISTAINKVCKQNFNSYVNEYRIKKAEKLLFEKGTNKLSIEGIGLEVGFHSKSAFYSAFKKHTGTTPTKYKNEIVY